MTNYILTKECVWCGIGTQQRVVLIIKYTTRSWRSWLDWYLSTEGTGISPNKDRTGGLLQLALMTFFKATWPWKRTLAYDTIQSWCSGQRKRVSSYRKRRMPGLSKEDIKLGLDDELRSQWQKNESTEEKIEIHIHRERRSVSMSRTTTWLITAPSGIKADDEQGFWR